MRKLLLTILVLVMVGATLFTIVACDTLSSASGSQSNETDSTSKSSYIISFETGTKQKIDSIECVTLTQSQAPIPDEKYNTGYSFEGWYLTSDFDGARLSFPYTFERNTTLYAKWVSKSVTRISTPEQLYNIRKDLTGNYVLANDIDLAEFGSWTPIGEPVLDYSDKKEDEGKVFHFTGSFDGNGYTISNMTIDNITADEEFNYLCIGLFGQVAAVENVANSGVVKNVILTNFKINLDGLQSRFYIGAIAGRVTSGGLVSHSSVQGEIINPEGEYEDGFIDSLIGSRAEPTENTYFGGAVGKLDNSGVTGCVNAGGSVAYVSTEGVITSESVADGVYAGGVVGYVEEGAVTHCNSSMNVKARYAGGLVGYNNGEVLLSSAVGKTEGSLSYPAITGGLVAYNFKKGTINRCYATGTTKARTAGGLVGVNVFDYETAAGGTIYDCYATGDVFGSEYAGGLIGRAVSDIPIGGRDKYSSKIYSAATLNSGITFKIIERCLSFGNVVANASETTYKDNDGNDVTITGVYYPVYAGSLIGQTNELLIGSCIAFGNVEGVSRRQAGDDYALNPAYVDNFVGHSTNRTSTYTRTYVFDGSKTYRNGTLYVGSYQERNENGVWEPKFKSGGYNTVDTISASTITTSYLIGTLGFNNGNNNYWNVANVKIEVAPDGSVDMTNSGIPTLVF